jgi:adenosylcobinamide kinase/adenosylcobinamide-phosphate guanylyltransferase
MHKITLVLGGGRSGKSTFAEKIAIKAGSDEIHRYYIATAEAFDDEMKSRISKHQERRGNSFTTIEESIHLSKAIESIQYNASSILIECLSVWLGNILYYHFKINESKEEKKSREKFMDFEIESLLKVLKNVPCPVVIVSNETNLEIFPKDDEESLIFLKRAEELNKSISSLSDSLYFCVTGIPLKLK